MMPKIKMMLTKSRPRTKRGYLSVGLLAAALFVILKVFFGGDTEVVEEIKKIPEVTIVSITELDQTSLFSTVGTVEAVSEAELKAESGGQVTAVYTDLGKYVKAGSIIAQFENARERAALISAQGSYEAAAASAATSKLGVGEAEIALKNSISAASNSYTSGYNSISGLVFTEIDDYFSDGSSATPGLRLNGYGNTLAINSGRVAVGTMLTAWQQSTLAAKTDGATVKSALEKARANVGQVISLVDMLMTAVSKENSLPATEEAQKQADITKLTNLRSTLLGLQNSLLGSINSVTASEEALARAKIAASNTNTPSLSGAQLKQALGALRAAEAQYEKTLVRTPIAGTVNSLNVKKGDYVSPSQDIALIANNNGLQTVTAINEADRERVKVGDIVTIVGSNATGTVAAIAGAVDPKTGKIAVKVSLPENAGFSNGASVSLGFGVSTTTVATNTPIYVPLSAVKLGADGAVMFSVDENKKLVAIEVELGMVLGDTVLIKSGITNTDKFVKDARGLKAGEEVTIKE